MRDMTIKEKIPVEARAVINRGTSSP